MKKHPISYRDRINRGSWTGKTGKKTWFRNACGNMYYGASLYFRRDFIEKMGYFDEAFMLLEDYPFVMKCIECREHIALIDKPLIKYGSSGISGKTRKKTSWKLAEDNLRMSELLCEKAGSLINSGICRDYLRYKREMWEKREGIRSLGRFRFFFVDAVVILSKLMSLLHKQDVVDCRFALLWRLEMMASRKRR